MALRSNIISNTVSDSNSQGLQDTSPGCQEASTGSHQEEEKRAPGDPNKITAVTWNEANCKERDRIKSHSFTVSSIYNSLTIFK